MSDKCCNSASQLTIFNLKDSLIRGSVSDHCFATIKDFVKGLSCTILTIYIGNSNYKIVSE